MSEQRREIGGYFGLDDYTGQEYHRDLIGVNSGRNALLYLLKARNVQKLYIPDFLCDTVYRLCQREGYPYEFYHVDSAFRPVFDKTLGEGEWLYVVNYYGQLSDEEIAAYKRQYDRVILDHVQAFFHRPVTGVDTVYSCRKFFGVPDGGYVATDAVWDSPLPTDSSAQRMTHVLGRYEQGGSAFYAVFQENDEQFYDLELRRMSPLTRNLLRGVDYTAAKQRREENYRVLAAALDATNRLPLRQPEGPYCYPYYCENGATLRKVLAAQQIYVPTLWPNVLTEGDALAQDYAANILPLPCDQRYTAEDMTRIVDALASCSR